MYIYIYMYTNLCTYLYACTYINTHTHIHLPLLQSTFTREIDDIEPSIWVQVYIRNLFHVRKCSSVLVCECLYTYINMVLCVHVRVIFHVRACSSVLVCVSFYIFKSWSFVFISGTSFTCVNARLFWCVSVDIRIQNMILCVHIWFLFHVRECSPVLMCVCLYTYIKMILCVCIWYLFHVHECSSVLVCVCLCTCMHDIVRLYLPRTRMLACLGVNEFIYTFIWFHKFESFK